MFLSSFLILSFHQPREFSKCKRILSLQFLELYSVDSFIISSPLLLLNPSHVATPPAQVVEAAADQVLHTISSSVPLSPGRSVPAASLTLITALNPTVQFHLFSAELPSNRITVSSHFQEIRLDSLAPSTPVGGESTQSHKL